MSSLPHQTSFHPFPAGELDQAISEAKEKSFFNYDPYSQALAKIERSHEQDMIDVRMMFETGLVSPEKVIDLFEQIRPSLYKYPAIDPQKFADKVRRATESEAD